MNAFFKKLSVLLSLFAFSNANAEIKITEVMPSNLSTITSDLFDYNGFVELYSDSEGVDLKGWKVINKKEGELNWEVTLDSTHILPLGYSLLFFGEKETSSETASASNALFSGMVPKKLCTEAGEILLVNGDDTVSMAYKKSYPHLSYDNRGYMEPTPGYENAVADSSIENRVALVTFLGNEPGAYDRINLEVELACATPDADIYYTLDGSIPTKTNGTKYIQPFELPKTTVVRARAYKDDMLFSEITTGSFIMPDDYHTPCLALENTLPIVSISTDDVNFFGDSLGIYVVGKNGITSSCTQTPSNYNQDWTRPVNFEYIVDGKVVDSQEVEVGVYGGCTRTYKTKSLKIKASKRTGSNRFSYNKFFAGRNTKKYKSLALRNGGNGYQYITPRWRDMFVQSLADGMNIDKQAMQPVAYYINGQYWGMMILTERTNEDYMYHNYGLDDTEVDLIEAGYNAACGTNERLWKMQSFVDKNYTKSDYFEKLGDYMDIDEYMDYQILEQYVVNTDWITNNLKLWRNRNNGKFRWILYDTDFGLSHAAVVTLDKDMHNYITNERGSKTARLLYSRSMQNEDFRWCFLDKYLDRIENHFTDSFIDAKFDSIKQLVAYETCAFLNNAITLKCPAKPEEEEANAEYMRNFAKQRKPYVVEQLKKLYSLGDDTVKVKIQTICPANPDLTPVFYFNDRKFVSGNYIRNVYSNERVKIKMEVPVGCKLAEWYVNDTLIESDGKPFDGNLLTRYAVKDSLVIKVVFDEDESYKLPNLFINEVCSSNESVLDENGDAPDWIEIYNADNKDVNLSGFALENVTKLATHVFPEKSNDVIVPANGYLLLWADKDVEKGSLHLSFKLSAATQQTLSLKAPDKGEMKEIDRIVTKVHSRDGSFGRESDGSENTVVFNNCSASEHKNNPMASPALSNGSLICLDVISRIEDVSVSDDVEATSEYGCVVVRNAADKAIRIYDSLGRLKCMSVADSDSYRMPLENGSYIVIVDNKGFNLIVK